MPGAFRGKFIDFTGKPVVQCDVQTVKNTSLGNNDNYNRK